MLRRLPISWRRIRLAFRSPSMPPSPESLEEARKRDDRLTVSRVATGNIRLQQGKYATRADLDREYEELMERGS